ncbi:MAG: tetratricopeptide repeat protein [Bacteroidota bacterium]|nr:tetratricopeptide repeat protein [Bacteroidota bacterium]
MIFCPKCNFEVDSGHNFCPSCGYDLRELRSKVQEDLNQQAINDGNTRSDNYVLCDVCGEETKVNTGYCQSCGAKLSGREHSLGSDIDRTAAKADSVDENEFEKKSFAKKDDSTISGQKQQKTIKPSAASPKAKIDKKVNSGNLSQKSLKPINIGIFIIALVALGVAILYFTGVFDSPKDRSKEIITQDQQQQSGSKISLDDLQKINDLESAVKKDTTNYSSILELAHRLNDSGFYERAIPYYRMYLRANPKNVDVLVDLGVCFFELKQFDNAKAVMKKGWNINPRHQIANFNLGIVNFSAGQLDSAKIWWRRAIEIDPNSEIGKKSKELLDSH